MSFGLILLSLVLSALGQDSKLVYKLITENNHILVQHTTAIWTHIRHVRNWEQFQKVACKTVERYRNRFIKLEFDQLFSLIVCSIIF